MSIYLSHFSNNYGDYGGALYLSNSQSNSMIQIMSSNFTNNNSTFYGGAIYFDQIGIVYINLSHFSNNFAYNRGGVIYLSNSQSNSMIQITSSYFTDNNSPNSYGGAIYFEQFGNLSIYSVITLLIMLALFIY